MWPERAQTHLTGGGHRYRLRTPTTVAGTSGRGNGTKIASGLWRSKATGPIHGGSTRCSATFGNGARTAGTAAITMRQWTAPPIRSAIPADVWRGAVLGSTARVIFGSAVAAGS